MILKAATIKPCRSTRLPAFHYLQIMLFSGVILFSGCTAIEVPYKKKQAFSKHVAKANKMEQQERLADALDQWRIATAIYPDSIEANQRSQSLENLINTRVAALIAQADIATKKRRFTTSVQLLLTALALQPDNQILIERVTAIKRSVAQGRVAANPSQADPNLNGERNWLAGASAVSTRAEKKFQLGVEVFNNDKNRAKQLFLEAVELDPTHLKARAYLQILSEKK